MGANEPLESARRIVASRLPAALGALLAGSALTSRRTDTSDLDIVVFVSKEGEAFRETLHEQGWLCELFVSTPSSFDYFVTQEIAVRRSPLLQMCAEGVEIFSFDGTVERYQIEARRLLAAGPPPLSDDERDQRRYRLSDLLDDFSGSAEGSELTFITGSLIIEATELALCDDRQWLGTGKWLARRLEEHNSILLARLNDAVTSLFASGDRSPLRSVVLDILERAGGPLSAGYRQDAPRF